MDETALAWAEQVLRQKEEEFQAANTELRRIKALEKAARDVWQKAYQARNDAHNAVVLLKGEL